MSINAFDDERREYNLMIINELTNQINNHPDIRFNQLLSFLDLEGDTTDHYYEEPWDTFNRIQHIKTSDL